MYPEFTPTTPMTRTVGSDMRSERLSGNDAVAQRQTQGAATAQPAGSGWFRDLLRSNRDTDATTAASSHRRAALIGLPLPSAGRLSETGADGWWESNEAPVDTPGAAPAASDAEAPAPSSPDDARAASQDRDGDEAPDDAGDRDEGDRRQEDGREATSPAPPVVIPVASSGTTDDASLALLFAAPGTGLGSSTFAGGVGSADAPRALPADPSQTTVQAQAIADPVTSVPVQLLVEGDISIAVHPAATPVPGSSEADSPLTQGSPAAHQSATGASPSGASPSGASPTGASPTGASPTGAASVTTPDGNDTNPAIVDARATPSLAASANGAAAGGAGDGETRDGHGTGTGAHLQSAGAGTPGDGTADEGSGTFGIDPAGLPGRTGAARAASRAGKPSAAPSPAAQVAQQLGKAARSGLQRIEIALEPAALGRIDVRLEFGKDGRIAAHFTAESREALDALRADARSLERALADAGVRADAGSLGFSLREQGSGDYASSRPSPMNPGAGKPAEATGSATDPAVTVADGTGGGPDGHLDIRA